MIKRAMKHERKRIKVRELIQDYITEMDLDNPDEEPLLAYGGRLIIRPAFQRGYVYAAKNRDAVINTLMEGMPLGLMYWIENADGTYSCLDGQQRTISICDFFDGYYGIKNSKLVNNGKEFYHQTIKRVDPELYEEMLDYELEVEVLSEIDTASQLSWFRTINIAGQALTDQELRNANYVSEWLTDAKRHFSRANINGAKAPAENLGGQYVKADANRQELLEKTIMWRVNSKEDEDICAYMEEHVNDEDCSDLWDYFNEVIAWVEELFPGMYDSAMKTVEWGFLYNEHKDEEFDIEWMMDQWETLIALAADKSIVASKAKILQYLITQDETLIKQRKFNDVERMAVYNQQGKKCADCGESFPISKLEAHHIIAWNEGGGTTLDNCVMICESCHNKRHNY